MTWTTFYPGINDPYYHVVPNVGREHVCEGLRCWCHPEPDLEQPGVILHNVEH